MKRAEERKRGRVALEGRGELFSLGFSRPNAMALRSQQDPEMGSPSDDHGGILVR